MPPASFAPDRDKALERLTLAIILALGLLRAWVAARALLSADEAYYWEWIRPLQWSYFDHPAMIALWIRAGTAFFGDTALGVRLLPVLSSFAVSVLIWDGARRAFPQQGVGARAALMLNATVLFDSAGIVATPDAPLLFFWSLCLWAMIRLAREGKSRYLFLAGLALGLGFDSKYTMALIVPGLLAGFLSMADLKAWWRRPEFYGAALLALALTAPVLFWNAAHGWASFDKQLGHALAAPAATGRATRLLVFVGAQFGLVTPLILLLCLWGMSRALYRGWRHRQTVPFLLGAISLPILLFFAEHSLDGLVQAHWPGPAYLGAVVAAAGGWSETAPHRRLKWLPAIATALGLAMAVAVLIQAATAFLPIPVKMDALKRLGGWDELAEAVDAQRKLHPGVFLFTDKHEATGALAFYLPDHPIVYLKSAIRPSFTPKEAILALKGRDALFVRRARDDDGPAAQQAYFESIQYAGRVDLHWGGRPADAYVIYFAKGYKGGAFPIEQRPGSPKDDPLPISSAAAETPVPARR